MKELRDLPKVDALSRDVGLAEFPEPIRIEAARRAIAHMREALHAGRDPGAGATLAREAAELMVRPSLRSAINLSGVVLHTGLGRARLADAAVEAIRAVAQGYANVEFDIETGKRGDRQAHVRSNLQLLTGAEDALVVNNAAGAVVLALAALAGGREVLLSRGEMVEIGGSFRMPEIVGASGCKLVEVGCTNKTRISDYERAIGPETGAILRCHPSNYSIVGFTEHPTFAELTRLAQAAGIPLIDDMGSGCIVDATQFSLPRLPMVQDSLRGGADVVIGSGDKLLGGPQAGIVWGRSAWVDKLRRRPFARCMRIDKLSLAGLEATLRLYVAGKILDIPTWRYLVRPLEDVKSLADRLALAAPGSVVAEGVTEIGGGSAPGTGTPTWRVGLSSGNPDRMLAMLRQGDPAIIGRIEDGCVWLDPRTLEESEVEIVEGALRAL